MFDVNENKWLNQEPAEAKLLELFRGMVDHNGGSQLQVTVKPLKKGKKDIILSSGKEFHFVLKPVQPPVAEGNPARTGGR